MASGPHAMASFWATYSGRGVGVSDHTVCTAFIFDEDNRAAVFNDGSTASPVAPSPQAVAGARALDKFYNKSVVPDERRQLAFVAVKLDRYNTFSTNPSEMHLFFNTQHGAWIVARSIPVADTHDTPRSRTFSEKTETFNRALNKTDQLENMSLVHTVEQQDVDSSRPALRYEGAVAYCMTIPTRSMDAFKRVTQKNRPTPVKDADPAVKTVQVSVFSLRLAAASGVANASDVYAVAMFTVDRPETLKRDFGPHQWGADDSTCALWRDPTDTSRSEYCLRLAGGGPGMAPVSASLGLHAVEKSEDADTQDPNEPMDVDFDTTAQEALFTTQTLADFTINLRDGAARRVHRATMYVNNPLMGILTRYTLAADFRETLPSLAADTVLSVVYTGKVVEHVHDKWMQLGPGVPDISVVAMARLFALLAGVQDQIDPLVALYAARNASLGNAADMAMLFTRFDPLDWRMRNILEPFDVHPRTKKHQRTAATVVHTVDKPTEMMVAAEALQVFTISVMRTLLDTISDAPMQVADYINRRLAELGSAAKLADDLEQRVGELVATMKREQNSHARAEWIVWAVRMVFAHPDKVPVVKVDNRIKDIRDLDPDFNPTAWMTKDSGIKRRSREVTHRKSPVARADTPPDFWDLDFPPSQ